MSQRIDYNQAISIDLELLEILLVTGSPLICAGTNKERNQLYILDMESLEIYSLVIQE